MPINRPILHHSLFKDKKIIFIDTEFYGTNRPQVTPVCAALLYHNQELKGGLPLQHTASKLWTHGDEGQHNRRLLSLIEDMGTHDGYVVASYSVEAECRFLHSIGVDYRKLKFIDIWVEYQMLMNKNNEIAYGRQLIKGKEKFTKPPIRQSKYEDPVDDGRDKSQAETGLVAAQYKLLKKKRDSKHKDMMRQLIIDGGPFADAEMQQILDYCYEDTVDLPAILDEIVKRYAQRYSKKDFSNVWEEMLLRGDYAMRSAQMVIYGYPVDVPRVKNLQENVPEIKNELAIDVNKIIEPRYGFKPYRYNKRDHSFSKNTKLISDALLEEYPDWPRSDKTLRASLKDEVLTKYTGARYEYRPTLVDQLVRIQKTESALRGFEQHRSPGKRSFRDYLGPDGRVRPYFGIYRAQSSRSQPQASGFIFLKGAWVRTLVQPSWECYIGDIDYGAEEWIIAAILSGDSAMLADYVSGDPYVSFGIRAGILPPDATKKTHYKQRVYLKSGALGRIYGLGITGLQAKLEYDTGRTWEWDEAKEIVDAFNTTYSDYYEYRAQLVEDYNDAGYIRLCDGWTMWGDNDNPLSVQNMPIQGTGAVVMRTAVAFSQDALVRVIKTLHDALYQEGYVADGLRDLNVMAREMQRAWHATMAWCGFPNVPDIRMEATAWGPQLQEDKILLEDGVTPCDIMPVFHDGRGKEDYKLYKKYLDSTIATDFDW